ncbi:hypothetical protein Drorol1_Dr00021542 [Drosera rotundifolia]
MEDSLVQFGVGAKLCGGVNICVDLAATDRYFYGDHSAVLVADGQLYTRGGGYSGKTSDASLLGEANFVGLVEEDLVKVPGLDGIKVIQTSVGAEHSALVTENRRSTNMGMGFHIAMRMLSCLFEAFNGKCW